MALDQQTVKSAAALAGLARQLKQLVDELDDIVKSDFDRPAGTDIRVAGFALTERINRIIDEARSRWGEKMETGRIQQETIDDLSKSQEEVNNLRSLSSAIALAQTRSEVVDLLLNMIRDNIVPFGSAALYQGSDEMGFALTDSWEATEEDRLEIERQRAAGFLDWVVKSHSAMAMPAEGKYPTAIYVPMKAGNRVTGIFLLLSPRAVEDFTQSDQERISLLCSQAAIALENARLVEQVLQMKQYNENLVLSLTSGLVAVNLTGMVTTLNPAGLDILGLNAPDIIGKSLSSVSRLEPLAKLLAEALQSGGESVKTELTFVEGDKKQILDVNISSVLDEDDRVTGVLGVFADLTPIKLLEQQVRRSDRLAVVGQLAAGAAHEIRNPLSAIRGNIQLLNRKLQKLPDGGEAFLSRTKSVIEEVDRINRIVGGMMELSKDGRLELKRVSFNQILRAVAGLVEGNYKEAGVGLDLALDDAIPEVMIDVSEMKQVILNLYQNALQAMKTNGKLTVYSGLVEDAVGASYVQVRIADSGCGIPKQHLEKVFAPFFTTKTEGTGLGLSIVHRIIEEHKGRITVDSVEGEGTTFTIWLPPARDEAKKEPQDG
ncbi:PAS domain-containing protein [bacterium]|nr:PAS domain-containing protein [bacterium]